MGLGSLTGVDMLASAMRDELSTIADVPVIAVSRSSGDAGRARTSRLLPS